MSRILVKSLSICALLALGLPEYAEANFLSPLLADYGGEIRNIARLTTTDDSRVSCLSETTCANSASHIEAGFLTGIASASFSLSDGALRSSVESLAAGSIVDSIIFAWDTLRFSFTGTVPFTVTLEGTVDSDPSINFGASDRRLIMAVYQYQDVRNSLYFARASYDSGDTPVPVGFFSRTLSGTLDVIAGNDFVVALTFEVLASHGGSLDFSNTAFLDLDLPEGQTFSSASGVFMSTPVGRNTVPEPPITLLTGTALFAWWRSSRRQARRAPRGADLKVRSL